MLIPVLRAGGLFAITAALEILGCWLAFLALRRAGSPWLFAGAALALGLFAWLLTFHPTGAAGRIYAAYGGVYVATSILWMRWVEKEPLLTTDWLGALFCLIGMSVILLGGLTR